MADIGATLDDCVEDGDNLQGSASTPKQDGRHAQWEAPDGGWGWVVLGATVLVQALTLAFPSCLGIFYTDLQTTFQSSNSETSWVPSIMTALLHAGGPFCSVLVEHFGCRITVMLGGVLSGLGMVASSFTTTISELYITTGIITGLGFCFSFQPAVTILGHYFVRRRAFANAVSSTGTAIGLSTLPFLSHFLRSELGWRGSFLVLGGILLNCCVCGSVMRPVGGPRHKGHGTAKTEEAESEGQPRDEKLGTRVVMVLRSLMASIRRHLAFDVFCGNVRFRIYSLGITWMMVGFMVPLVYLVPYATANGMEKSRAALLLTILGFVNIFVRPMAGLLFGLPWFKGRHVYMFSAALLVNGLSNSICCVSASFPVLLSYVVVYGLSMSVVGALLFTVLMNVVEMSRFPAALGLLCVMESITLLLGPPLAGIVVDSTGQYSHVFYVCSAAVASSAIFLMVSFCWLDYTQAKSSGPLRSPAHKPAIILSDCQDGIGVQKVEASQPMETAFVTVA
ncbi:monocarboxylate transporter 6-like [Scleropages formosus]|uniref:Monocarboxylate transporter 6-like n=1 Tax=Scleropages formosus TaxID=113540 RepID=A0A0P7Y2H6_SCLFO|nr:monocarboxylate transporter 6-like [Scleropages formosus]XP_018600804.1 monocarboxylate transporter 6-like [Scleropages formosus]KPP59870.1 monocarboxylate transporter 6-like [Scleropages formosus]